MNTTNTTPKAILVIGHRWTDSNGNTYHTATVYVDGTTIGPSPISYGYGTQYAETADNMLEAAGLMPGREHHKNGSSEAAWRYFERNGVKYGHHAIDVQRKKDL